MKKTKVYITYKYDDMKRVNKRVKELEEEGWNVAVVTLDLPIHGAFPYMELEKSWGENFGNKK